jgi:hypothetical protein
MSVNIAAGITLAFGLVFWPWRIYRSRGRFVKVDLLDRTAGALFGAAIRLALLVRCLAHFIFSGSSVNSPGESCVANNSNLNCRPLGRSWTCYALLAPFSDGLRVLSRHGI